MSVEHTDDSGAATDEIGPVVDDVQAMHAEALALFEDSGGEVVEPDVDEGQPDGEPEADLATDDDDAGDGGDYEAESDGTDDVDTPDEDAEKERLLHADYTRKTQELAAQRKEIEADRQRLRDLVDELGRRNATPAPEPLKAPVEPPADAPQSEWTEFWKDHQAYQARIAQEQSPETQQYREYLRQVEQQRAIQEAGEKSVSHIRAREDYSPEVEQRMFEIVQQSPFWLQACYSTEGADELYGIASKQLAEQSAAQRAEKKVRRSAEASKGKVPPPGSKSRARPPQKNVADMSVEDLNAEARRMSGLS